MRVLDAKGVMEPYREPRGSRGWFILILGVVVFATFGGVVGYAYMYGLPGMGGEPPLIHAAAGPYRRAPSDRGGLEVANSSSSIVSVLRPTNERPRVERLLPPETAVAMETPEPAPAPAPVASDTAASTVREPAATPAPAAPMPAAPTETSIEATAGGVPVPQPKPADPLQLAAREPPATISALPRAVPPSPAPPTPAQPSTPIPAPAPAAIPTPAPTPAPTSTSTSTSTSTPAPAASAPRQLTPAVEAPPQQQRQARTEPPAQAAAPTTRSSESGGVFRLQLTAVRSDAGLAQAWADLKQRYPSVLASVSPKIERTDTGSGPLFRLQAGPFANREAASNACATIRSSGGQCFIVGPISP